MKKEKHKNEKSPSPARSRSPAHPSTLTMNNGHIGRLTDIVGGQERFVGRSSLSQSILSEWS